MLNFGTTTGRRRRFFRARRSVRAGCAPGPARLWPRRRGTSFFRAARSRRLVAGRALPRNRLRPWRRPRGVGEPCLAGHDASYEARASRLCRARANPAQGSPGDRRVSARHHRGGASRPPRASLRATPPARHIAAIVGHAVGRGSEEPATSAVSTLSIDEHGRGGCVPGPRLACELGCFPGHTGWKAREGLRADRAQQPP